MNYLSRIHRVLQCLKQGNSLTTDVPSLHGKTFLITGGSSGIGAEVARGLYQAGAQVILSCRSASKGERTIANIYAQDTHHTRSAPEQSNSASTAPAIILLASADTADLCSMQNLVRRLHDELKIKQLDGLILNAGIASVDYQLSKQGYELHCATNVLGHHYLVKKLLPLLAAATDPRVIYVTGDIYVLSKQCALNQAYKYLRFLAYARSKLGVTWNALSLDEHKEALNIAHLKSIAVHPGVVATDLVAGFDILKNKLLISPQQGAASILYALSSNDVTSGDYIHNVHRFLNLTPSDPALNKHRREKFWRACNQAVEKFSHQTNSANNTKD